MRLYFTHVLALDPERATAELNQFLSAHRVVSIERELVSTGATAYWAIAVTWLDARAPAEAKRGATDLSVAGAMSCTSA